MRSTNKTVSVLVGKIANHDLPTFIHMMHRHLEKEGGTSKDLPDPTTETFIVPVDLMGLSIAPSTLEGIEEVSLVYKKKPITP